MINKILTTLGYIFIIAIVVASFLYRPEVQVIGGDRTKEGCLTGGGFTWSEEVGACIREFDMTPDIKNAAKLAVDYVGREYALTVVSFNSYEELGSYDIMFEKGLERIKQTVYIKNWQIQK